MADVKITNHAPRLFIIPLGGGKVLRIAPLATVPVEPQDVERVRASLKGPLLPHVIRGHLIVEGLIGLDAPPNASQLPQQPQQPPLSAATEPSAGPTPTLPFSPAPATEPIAPIPSTEATAPASSAPPPSASSGPVESSAAPAPAPSSSSSKKSK